MNLDVLDLSFFGLVAFFVVVILAFGVAVFILEFVRETFSFLLAKYYEINAQLETLDETKIRQEWKTALFISFSSVIILSIADTLSRSPATTQGLLELLFGGLVFAALGWATYHCAYKKRGSALVAFSALISGLTGIGFILESFGKAFNSSCPAACFLIWVICGCLLIYYASHCYKLCTLNESYNKNQQA